MGFKNRPFIACVVVLNREEWHSIANHLGVDPEHAASLNVSEVQRALMEQIQYRARAFPHYAIPRALLI